MLMEREMQNYCVVSSLTRFSKPTKDICPFEPTSGPADTVQANLRNYLYVFMLANMLHGCATVPFYTLSIAYMDDNLSTRKSARYIGKLLFLGFSFLWLQRRFSECYHITSLWGRAEDRCLHCKLCSGMFKKDNLQTNIRPFILCF